jgi:hypothetical protein
MDIQHTFEVYRTQLDNLRRHNSYGRPQVLNQFRMQFKGFSETDIETLKDFLLDDDKKWFVADLLDHLREFPRDLLRPMLYSAVIEPDTSFNNEFIKPCRRVFDYADIQKILLDIFQNGSKDEKIGVLKALYWARPTVYSLQVHSGGKVTEQQGYDVFEWDDELKSYNYDFNFVEDKSIFEREHQSQQTAYKEQLKVILSEFYKTNDIELKYQIALRLPKELNDYPNELKEQAKQFLVDKNGQGIPNNISELDKVQHVKSSFLRWLLLMTGRIFNKKGHITLKQR